MKREQMPLVRAYTYLRSCRPQVKPKANFLKQLVDYEKTLIFLDPIYLTHNLHSHGNGDGDVDVNVLHVQRDVDGGRGEGEGEGKGKSEEKSKTAGEEGTKEDGQKQLQQPQQPPHQPHLNGDESKVTVSGTTTATITLGMKGDEQKTERKESDRTLTSTDQSKRRRFPFGPCVGPMIGPTHPSVSISPSVSPSVSPSSSPPSSPGPTQTATPNSKKRKTPSPLASAPAKEDLPLSSASISPLTFSPCPSPIALRKKSYGCEKPSTNTNIQDSTSKRTYGCEMPLGVRR